MTSDEEVLRRCIATMQQVLAVVVRELDGTWHPGTVSAMLGNVTKVCDKATHLLDALALVELEGGP